uniref:Uncharacterized protein AlNc14C16G1774 n=1 Tax=Albugo laibachii Nc14 TaxID=890382 RepID=F0W4A0_9STRA|nr:conserved hypothetical protein [Albugo laibachii Nc14]|eukprot:CCA15916.1 conserved hypothetical protein [Albugo laibachii Nc14]
MVHVARAILPHLRPLYGLHLKTLNDQVRAMVECMNCPKYPWDLSVILTTDQQLHRLNKQFRKQDKTTDILSFPSHNINQPGRFPNVRTPEDRYLGDIYISLPYVKKYCDEEGTDINEQMRVLFAHGICHLMGYDHETDQEHERMAKAEDYLLRCSQKKLSVPMTR